MQLYIEWHSAVMCCGTCAAEGRYRIECTAPLFLNGALPTANLAGVITTNPANSAKEKLTFKLEAPADWVTQWQDLDAPSSALDSKLDIKLAVVAVGGVLPESDLKRTDAKALVHEIRVQTANVKAGGVIKLVRPIVPVQKLPSCVCA